MKEEDERKIQRAVVCTRELFTCSTRTTICSVIPRLYPGFRVKAWIKNPSVYYRLPYLRLPMRAPCSPMCACMYVYVLEERNKLDRHWCLCVSWQFWELLGTTTTAATIKPTTTTTTATQIHVLEKRFVCARLHPYVRLFWMEMTKPF